MLQRCKNDSKKNISRKGINELKSWKKTKKIPKVSKNPSGMITKLYVY